MIQEIEQIKAAERDAILRIETAKIQADLLIQKAREDTVMQLENRIKEAENEVKNIRSTFLAHARTLSAEISDKTDRETEELVADGEIRIPAAVDLIVKRTVGGSDVLSGTNG